MYQSEKEVRAKAGEFVRKLEFAGFDAEIVADSFRDYTAKILVGMPDAAPAKVSIYFSPKKNSYSIKISAKEAALQAEIEKIWAGNIVQKSPGKSDSKKKAVADTRQRSGCEIYVDGSYIRGKIGYGAVVLIDSPTRNSIMNSVLSAF